MKIYSKHIKIQTSEVPYEVDRINRLADLEWNTLEFVNWLFLDIRTPTIPTFMLGNIRGFDNINASVKDIIGSVKIYVNFFSVSGKRINIDIPLIVYHGKFLKPSTCVHNNKKYIFSQSLIDTILANCDPVKPILNSVYSNDPVINHLEVVNTGIFQPIVIEPPYLY